MERYCTCVECGYPKAELKFEERIVERDGKDGIRLAGAPYYLCPACGEKTYDFHAELKIEKLVESLGDTRQTINLTRLFGEIATNGQV
ncbi:MAG: hypothetical protein H0Z39_02480 [Peptococcaceae bacterium]|nr:hypothetical protein [Peptococcaceae bacterium]